jgi:hypothetical protein
MAKYWLSELIAIHSREIAVAGLLLAALKLLLGSQAATER